MAFKRLAHARTLRLAFTVAAAGVATGAGLAAGFVAHESSDVLLPGLFISGVPVGGLEPQQARARLAAEFQPRFADPILLVAGDRTWSVDPATWGISPDFDSTVHAAETLSRRGGPLRRLANQLVTAHGWDVPLHIAVDEAAMRRELQSLAAQVERPPTPARFAFAGDRVEIVGGTPGQSLDLDQTRLDLLHLVLQSHQRTLRLKIQRREPSPSASQLAALGLEHPIATYATRFNPNQFARTHNIRLAAEALNGTLLAPGEAFSFNDRVGPRLARLGFQEAPVIVNGEPVPDIGGGVCQVSTTLYNAVLLAGLQIDTRVPHSVPASYVPLGRDATVAYDYIDFAFRNDGREHILIQARVDGDRLTVRLYGAEAPTGTVSLVSVVDEVLEPPVVEVADPSLAAGASAVDRPGMRGYRVTTYRTVEHDGRIVERQVVERTEYKAWERRIRVGRSNDSGVEGGQAVSSNGEDRRPAA